MEVAARRSPHTALAAGFAQSPGLGDLERRVRALVPSKRGARGPRLVVQSALSCIGVSAALGVPAPAHTAVLVEGPVIAPMDAGSPDVRTRAEQSMLSTGRQPIRVGAPIVPDAPTSSIPPDTTDTPASRDTLDTQVATPSLAELRDPPQDLPRDIRVDRDGRIDWGDDVLGPLIVIDGVIVGETPPDLEATDIASIEVIRGAAAVRLYGSRAEDGVILITTKASDRAVAPEPAGIRVGQDREVVWGQSLAGVLILIDGEVSDAEAVRGLDAGEIRSIEVIRGTAAVRLYGSQGENGVILVTTGRIGPG
jgi:TonB-dependent SusC/RagA subfamily outer membrane receptor